MTAEDRLRELVPDVSRETLDRLDTYAALVRRWNPRINLVSRSSLEELWTRHILDSAQLHTLAGPADLWADLGSGGGFPGLVVAILRQGAGEKTRFVLVESDQRKATFLRTAARETGTEVTVLTGRIETLEPIGADVISARALAPLTTLLEFADCHLRPGGLALFPKGATWREELRKALETRAVDCQEYPSLTDPKAVILKIGASNRV